MSVDRQAYERILSGLAASGATLVAVSKTKPAEDIEALYALGQRDFGENYVQELVSKQAALPSDIRWHFIGHLQRNKVKYIAPFVHLIHGVDSLRLLQEVDRQAVLNGRRIDCLLQMHIAREETKFGLDREELTALLDTAVKGDEALKNVRIRGLMGMASFTDDGERVRSEFRHLHGIFKETRSRFFEGQDSFSVLSMGMSGDYAVALEEGSTMVRIGSLLFGAR
jgi:pyridoxal phosphate enzyme (YggS family)